MSGFRVTPGQQLARISARHDGRQEIEQFDPTRYSLHQAAADYGIEQAKQIKDWPALEEAVDFKIGEQIKFVAWWHASVTPLDNRRVSVREPGHLIRVGDAQSLTGMTKQRVSELGKRLTDLDSYRRHLLGAEYFAAYLAVPLPRGATGTGENEWFTPERYIVLARRVLGEIDLDPATSQQAQQVIRASDFYTAETDGLKQDWHGRVWLNPPFAQPAIEQFVSKMVSEYTAKRVSAAIMLTHNYTDTTWFHEAANAATAICFTRGRVKFYKPNGTIAAPTQGQAFFYFGDERARFISEFAGVGFAVVRP